MGWTIGFVLGGVVVLVVAALLIAILLVARTIERLAGRALGVAGEIKAVTKPIWLLADVNSILDEIAGTVRSVEAQVGAIADEVERGPGA
jgi:hypothetical protein